MKDFFVNYNRNDRDWAEWIAWQLEENGYTTVIQAWDFPPGGNFVLDMQEATSNARRTIAVLSPDRLEARFTAPEWAAAFARDPTGSQGLLVPVRVRECEPKGLLPQIVYIDLVGLGEQWAKERLLQEIKSECAKPSAPPHFPGHAPDLPATRPNFPGPPPPVAIAARPLSRPKAWMLAAMIDKKPQAKHLRHTAKRTGRRAYFLIGHQREWPEALAYRLALDLAMEDIASFRLPAKLSIRMSALEDHDRVRDSLYKRLAGKLQGAWDESLALVERLRFRLTEEKAGIFRQAPRRRGAERHRRRADGPAASVGGAPGAYRAAVPALPGIDAGRGSGAAPMVLLLACPRYLRTLCQGLQRGTRGGRIRRSEPARLALAHA